MSTFLYNAPDEAATVRLGQALAEVLPEGAVVALNGTLGAGKTRLVQALAEALGVPRGEVTSPTFVLVNEYQGRKNIYHFDAYRLHDEDEFLDLGPEEYFSRGGLVLIEWAQRVEGSLPRERLEICIELPDVGQPSRLSSDEPGNQHLADAGARRFAITAKGDALTTVLEALRDRLSPIEVPGDQVELPLNEEPANDAGELPVIAVEQRRAPAIKPVDPAPRFGLAHLMLWVTGCSVCFALVRNFAAAEPGALGFVYLLVMALVYGGAWMGLAVVVSRWWRNPRLTIQPGHWLAALYGIEQCLEAAQLFVPTTALAQRVLPHSTACLFACPMFSRRLSVRWRIFFGMAALLVTTPLLYVWLSDYVVWDLVVYWFTWLRNLGIVLALAIVLILDRRDSLRRDWLHRLGIGVALWHMLAPLWLWRWLWRFFS